MSSRDEMIPEVLRDKENENNVRRLREHLKSRMGIIPFIGAGLSKPFGYPLWGSFLMEQARSARIEEMIEKCISAGEYEEAAEYLLKKDDRAFNKAIEDTFGDHIRDNKKLDGAILFLPQLAAGPIITTNFDHTLEEVFKNAGHPFIHKIWGAKIDMFTKAIRENKSFLLKIHGDVDDRTDRVLTLTDYMKHYGDSDPSKMDQNLILPRLIRQMLTTRIILFIGCSLNKDRTIAIMRQVAIDYPAINHYAIVEKPEQTVDFQNRANHLSEHGIYPIWYPRGEHDQMTQILSYLVKQIPEKFKRENIGTNNYVNIYINRDGRQIEPENAKIDTNYPKTITNSIGMKFVFIDSGVFKRGSEESDYEWEKPVLQVEIKQPFYLGVYPVTQHQWKELMKEYLFCWDKILVSDNSRLIESLEKKFNLDWVKTAKIEKIDDKTINIFTEKSSILLRLNNEKTRVILYFDDDTTSELIAKMENQELKIYMGTPSYFKGDNLPIEKITWNDVQEFIKKLNEKECTNKYFLPSEAEWEYAARAGTTTEYSFGNDDCELGEYAWYVENSESKTHPVGKKHPNQWGLYDMAGNVWEWVQDGWNDDYEKSPTDGSTWMNKDSSLKVVRGGCFGSISLDCRSAARTNYHAGVREHHLGFRVMKVL